MFCFIDTETSGLFPRGAKYKNLNDFENARIVSICWIISQGDSIIEQSYYIIKPDGFTISDESIAIHGITNEYARDHGQDLKEILRRFGESIKNVEAVIAHNINFDETIIKSEMHRYDLKDVLNVFKSKHKICTMIKGRLFMKVRKYPKLEELYKFLYNEDIVNAHNALSDTLHCYKCFIRLFPSDPGVFYFGNKKIVLTDEQRKVVFSDFQRSMLVLAGAGSGKSSTIVTRIKYLLDQGVRESSIILTTFTRNAANDMKDKLFEIMGYKSDIVVGTIDSIAKYYIELNKEVEVNDVEQYAPEFLKMIRKRPQFFSTFKYLFVDEVQDINQVQFEIMYEFYKNGVYIIGIGDDCQNIYEFRGSNIKYILHFQNYFENSDIYKLNNNFRSTREIVAVANESIKRNQFKIPKTMVASNPNLISGPQKKPRVKFFPTESQQFRFVLDKIKEYIEEGVKEDHICVMSYTNKPLQLLHKILVDNNINAYYNSGNDDTKIVKMSGYVNLNTIHKAKGLEYKFVFLVNMNDQVNLNVYKYNSQDKGKCQRLIEANRRVFYVGVTRAEKELYILTDYPSEITRFVTELDSDLFD